MTGVQTESGVLAGDERMLIDGELQITSSKATFDVIHPATEEVAGQATDGTVDDMARAIGAARRAFDMDFMPCQVPSTIVISSSACACEATATTETRRCSPRVMTSP